MTSQDVELLKLVSDIDNTQTPYDREFLVPKVDTALGTYEASSGRSPVILPDDPQQYKSVDSIPLLASVWVRATESYLPSGITVRYGGACDDIGLQTAVENGLEVGDEGEIVGHPDHPNYSDPTLDSLVIRVDGQTHQVFPEEVYIIDGIDGIPENG